MGNRKREKRKQANVTNKNSTKWKGLTEGVRYLLLLWKMYRRHPNYLIKDQPYLST